MFISWKYTLLTRPYRYEPEIEIELPLSYTCIYIYTESKKISNNDEATKRKEDTSFVNITRQHFPEDRDALVSRVNSGTKK